MRFKSPSPFSLAIVLTSALIVIYIFTGIQDTPEFSENKRIVSHNGDGDEAPLYLGGTERQRASPSFLLKSERNRKIFLKKVEDEILQGKDPKSMPASGFADTWFEWFVLWMRNVDLKWFAFWNVFTPIYSCPHVLIRVGTLADGGKWTCGVDLFEDSKEDPCVVYSFGVGGDSSFEIEMVTRTNCTVYAFDDTRNKMAFRTDLDPKLAERIHFFKVGIGSKYQVYYEDLNLRTLKGLMHQNGHTWIDFLKMDIEFNEYSVLEDIAEDFETFPFGHLNLEVHLEEWDAFGRMYKYWKILERRGLRAFFWEPNFYAAFRNSPFYMEFSFINVVDSRSRLLRF